MEGSSAKVFSTARLGVEMRHIFILAGVRGVRAFELPSSKKSGPVSDTLLWASVHQAPELHICLLLMSSSEPYGTFQKSDPPSQAKRLHFTPPLEGIPKEAAKSVPC